LINFYQLSKHLKDEKTQIHSSKSRRKFMQTSAAVARSVVMSPFSLASTPHVNVDNTIKIALIGCGARGSGAANEALNTGDDVRLVAMADAFQEKLDASYNHLVELHGKKVAVKEENKFVGLDGYKNAIGFADVVFLASPPGFRSLHFEEAVNQGKHIFMEKPVATDVPGVRKIIENAKRAKQKNLKVVVGHHLRFQKSCIETINKLKEGIIGDILNIRAYFNTGGVWVRDRKAGMTEMEYQVWNWYYFNWLSGDHIAEQHVHDLDLMNWLKGAHPVKAQGMGGRQVRTGNEYGEIFDHHYVEYQYPDGTYLNSQCRHQKGVYVQLV
jgi:myo-inositol 2-dehydrogenase/D-chiro-inositol 1-dehydrogenase